MDQFRAARKGKVKVLGELLTDNVDDKNESGETALHCAANHGHVHCVQLCLHLEANVNSRDGDGWTPLHKASTQGQTAVARVLLDAGANVDATNADGRTPLRYAIRNYRSSVVKLLIDRGANVAAIKLDRFIPILPDWVNSIIGSSYCRTVAIIIIGIRKYQRTTTAYNDINVIRLIGKHIWTSRNSKAWIEVRWRR
jgi:ankyrin repeat protein